MKRYEMISAGRVPAAGQFEIVTSPYDGTLVGEVAVAGRDHMKHAIKSAVTAFATMRRLPSHERISILEKTAAAIRERGGHIATVMAQESGKPIRYCAAEVERAVVTFSLAASACRDYGGEVMPIDLEPRGEGRLCLYSRVPRGPVAAISPFNFPLNLIAHKVAPAVAVGASVVLKAPPQCPITAHVLGEIMLEVGLPAGALNVLHCPPEIAQMMVEDARLKVLSFTGSDEVGWKLKALAGSKQVLLELGGNAPCIIDETVDLDDVVDRVVMGAWANAGQVCIKVQRVLVHDSLFDDFLARFVDKSRAVVCGDPMNPETVVGPLIERSQVERVLEWVGEAQAGGATVHCGGQADGNVVAPTVLTGTTADMRVVKDEIFGPVTTVESFETFDGALASANAGRYGLQAGVFTRDLQRALKAYRELDFGGVVIGDVPTFRADNVPYGGTKDSGFGREGVRFAMDEMSEPKLMIMRDHSG